MWNRLNILWSTLDDSGYWRVKTTSKFIRRHSSWPPLQKIVGVYVRSGHFFQLSVPAINDSVSVIQPVLGFFTRSLKALRDGYPSSDVFMLIYLLSVQHLTSWLVLQLEKSQISKTAIKLLNYEVFGKFGSAHTDVTNNDTTFLLTAWLKALSASKILHKQAALYGSRSNDRVDGMVQIAECAVRKMVADGNDKWWKHLAVIERSYRPKKMKHGYPP